MGLNKEGGEQEECLTTSSFLKHTFHTLSLTLLTLLLPLSFLLLARLTSPNSSTPPPSSTLLSIFLHSNPLIHFLISFLSISSLLHSLTGHHLPNPPTIISWSLLCTFQACISLGIEATILSGIKPLNPTGIAHVMWIERVVFFVALYETMLVWGRMFVRPVVDETVFGVGVKEGGADTAVIGAAFGVMWFWMLRDEVETMMLAAGIGGLEDGVVGWNGFVVWLVSYSTVATGMVRIVEVVVWGGKLLFLFLCCRGVDEVSVCSVPESDQV